MLQELESEFTLQKTSLIQNIQQILSNLIQAYPHQEDHPWNEKNSSFLDKQQEKLKNQLPSGLPEAFFQTLKHWVQFQSPIGHDQPILPCPFKQHEATHEEQQSTHKPITVNLDRALLYLNTVVWAYAEDPVTIMKALPNTDYHSTFPPGNVWRFASTNIYQCRDGHYYHLHGSLNATPTFEMLKLPPFLGEEQNNAAASSSTLTEQEAYERIAQVIRNDWNSDEIEWTANETYKQAGTRCWTREEFLASEHGKIIHEKPLWEVEKVVFDQVEKPRPLSRLVVAAQNVDTKSELSSPNNESTVNRILEGVKVLVFGRAIAAPAIGRNLAEYGAHVLKVIGPQNPDGSVFQLDNVGQHSCFVDLKTEEGKKQVESLIMEADVLIQGYRPGALEKLGFGFDRVSQLVQSRGYGIVYVSEDCYGSGGPLSHRSGWQQIADCFSGVAWAQGRALGLEEPVIPLLPISDYCCGVMGACAALDGLYRRCKYGGSYYMTTSLTKYNDWLQELGMYPDEVVKELIQSFGVSYRCHDNMLAMTTKTLGGLLKKIPKIMLGNFGKFEETPFKIPVKYLKPVVSIQDTVNEFLCPPRPHGYDKPEFPNYH
ncbi:hypothetical protein C9374_012387 [Naegleria lovaniensis]|uniref:Uncharacterized protein n=1 Tax=Naegleria lovaniensis TaxID=51637 RepID=A0AA88GWB8_NAELO|nr:uncharacterized protein C9374_012387 [Naegleria lovaniensis]KAG2392135.1 hypothetical protein C9374_012387 [Naegleria lovaniensis]